MFKDLKEGQTHSENDRCGEVEHNQPTEDKQSSAKGEKCKHDWRQDGTAEGYISCVKCGAMEKLTQVPAEPTEDKPWQEKLKELLQHIFGVKDLTGSYHFEKIEDFITQLLQEQGQEHIRLKTIDKANSYEMGISAGYKQGRKEIKEEMIGQLSGMVATECYGDNLHLDRIKVLAYIKDC